MNWFSNLSAKAKLVLGFLMTTAFTVGVGYLGLSNLSRMNDAMSELYDRDFIGLNAIREAEINMFIVARSVRHALLDPEQKGVEDSRTRIENSGKLIRDRLDKAAPLMATEQGTRLLNEARSELELYLGSVRQVMAFVDAGKRAEGFAHLNATQKHGWNMSRLIGELSALKEKMGAKSKGDAEAMYQATRTTSIAMITGAALLSILISLLFARWFGRALLEVTQIAGTVSRASNELASTTEELASGAQEQAASIEETAATLEELTATVKQNADNAQQASQLASASRDMAERGGRIAGEAVGAMKEVNRSASRIAEITTTIDEIAFQTNLLALNAAVEAARAGEQGRGFAVVATEVRNLAQRSATAAKEIKALIDDSVGKIENGYQLVESSGSALSEILASTKRVTDFVAEIAAASREQANGLDQVNLAVTQMDQVTQSNASQTEELSATAESLAQQATRLEEVVDQFHLMADAQRGSATTGSFGAPPPRAPRRPAAQARRPRATTVARGSIAPPAPRRGAPSREKLAERGGTSASDAELDNAFEEI